MSHGADPRARPHPPPDNRWQRGDVVDALYLADAEPTLWAEWYRHLAEAGIPPLYQLPRDVWSFEIGRLTIADLTTDERLVRVGLDRPRPGRHGWPSFQAIGETLHREGWGGLLSPSAARPDGLVLCLFIPPGMPLPATPKPPPEVVREPPVPPTGMRT